MTAGVLEAVGVRMVASNLAPDRAAIAVHHGPDFGERQPRDPHRLNTVAFLLRKTSTWIADSTFQLINKTGVATAA